MNGERLVIIDDEQDMLDGLTRLLGYELPALSCETFVAPRAALEAVRDRPPDLVLLDVRMPDIDGMALLKVLLREVPWLTCLMMTAHGTIELAVAAIKSGAYDFIAKPFETDALVRMLAKGLERSRLIQENRALRDRVERGDFHGLLGRSPAMQHLFDQIRAVARSDYSVLIRGESGTGKELAARAVHAESRRRQGPFVTVNCPATPEYLLESELFGHRRGAFTGADHDRGGLFEEARGGTIFLDEIADIPIGIQTKLLRTLQDGEIKALGADRPDTVDVRVVAATNQDLEDRIRARTFREDLYYRLNVVTLKTPPLREIPEDIPLIASHFLRLASHELEAAAKRLAPEALQALALYRWPGNVRQLQNTVRRAAMFTRRETIEAGDLSFPSGTALAPALSLAPTGAASEAIVPYKDAKLRILDQFTRAYVENLLRQSAGNVTRAAALSGIRRPSLQKIIRRLGLRPAVFR
jgi:DNA-binding NtrC family response regulator